jgi:hypothetical protein
MNCQHFKMIVPDFSRNPKSSDEIMDAKKHIEECAACAAFLRRENELTAALRKIAEEDQQLKVSNLAGSKVETFFRSRHRKTSRALIANPRFSWLTAAAIGFFVLGGMVRFLVQSVPLGQSDSRPAHPRANNTSSAQKLGYVQDFTNGTNEVATEYFPLVPSEQTTGTLQRVRVLVPRSSLLQFGLPMNEERSNEPIAAELLVGDDGAPRAIRFIQYTQ